MVILKQLKKQINQFVTPDIKPIYEDTVGFYSRKNEFRPIVSNEEPAVKQECFDSLESIYAIETIDVKTIRPLGNSEDEALEGVGDEPSTTYELSPNDQLELKLGGEFRSYIDSLILNEPVHVLDISPNAHKGLISIGVCFIRDLIDTQWDSGAVFKGIGQGHIDEAKRALKAYLKGKVITHCESIDFESWIRSLIPDDQKSKHYLLLKEYDLHRLITLTPTMNVEMKRISSEGKLKFIADAKEVLGSNDRVELSKLNISTVTDVFVTPWLRERCGIAKRYEIIDRLEQVSENPRTFRQAMAFLSEIYSSNAFLLNDSYPIVNQDVYCVDSNTEHSFKEVERLATSYFYKDDTVYELSELLSWIARELAVNWKGYQTEFIEKVVRYSQKFSVYKGMAGTQVVTLN